MFESRTFYREKVYTDRMAAQQHMDVTATELAAWIREHHPNRVWTVDGDMKLMEELSMPCFGENLAVLLERRGGRKLRLFRPVAGRDGHTKSIGDFALEDGLVFAVAWVDAADSRRPSEASWALVIDTLAESILAEEHNEVAR